MNHHPDVDNSTVNSEADYFRQLIEKQPAVLMRVRLDGELLAANHSALGLLGADDLDQLAGLTLSTCIAPEHRSRWNEFSTAIGNGTSNSFECDFTNLVGACRTIVFHGVPLMDNRDGIASIVLSAHDMSTVRWSEAVFENTDSFARQPPEPPEPVEPQQGRLEQLERLLRDGRNISWSCERNSSGKTPSTIARRNWLNGTLRCSSRLPRTRICPSIVRQERRTPSHRRRWPNRSILQLKAHANALRVNSVAGATHQVDSPA